MADSLEAVKKETDIRLSNMEKTLSSIDKKINGISAKLENINLLEYKIGELAEKHDKLVDDLNKKHHNMDCRVTAIEQKPAKKWEGLASHVLTLAVGSIITFVITQLLNK